MHGAIVTKEQNSMANVRYENRVEHITVHVQIIRQDSVFEKPCAIRVLRHGVTVVCRWGRIVDWYYLKHDLGEFRTFTAIACHKAKAINPVEVCIWRVCKVGGNAREDSV